MYAKRVMHVVDNRTTFVTYGQANDPSSPVLNSRFFEYQDMINHNIHTYSGYTATKSSEYVIAAQTWWWWDLICTNVLWARSRNSTIHMSEENVICLSLQLGFLLVNCPQRRKMNKVSLVDASGKILIHFAQQNTAWSPTSSGTSSSGRFKYTQIRLLHSDT